MWKPVTKVIYNRLEQDGDLRTDGVTTIEEKEIARRITAVGLWNIETLMQKHHSTTMEISFLRRFPTVLKVTSWKVLTFHGGPLTTNLEKREFKDEF